MTSTVVQLAPPLFEALIVRTSEPVLENHTAKLTVGAVEFDRSTVSVVRTVGPPSTSTRLALPVTQHWPLPS